MKKTYQPKKITRSWHLVDAREKVLGRMATEIVKMLMGKHKVDYAPQADMGDYVVVINAKYLRVTGEKKEKKVYYRHSGYPGGFKKISFQKLFTENPRKVVELAVKRMLPNNRLRDRRMRRLYVYEENNHPYKNKFVNS